MENTEIKTNKELLKKAPELRGSDRQVAWAESIREEFLNGADEWATEILEHNKDAEDDIKRQFVELTNKLKIFIVSQATARWFIDNRYSSAGLILKLNRKLIDKFDIDSFEKNDYTVIEPTEKRINTVAMLTVTHKTDGTNWLSMNSEKDDYIIATVKDWGFEWDLDDYAWKHIVETDQANEKDPDNYLIETACKMLKEGIPVRVDAELAESIINQDYIPTIDRWIEDYNDYYVAIGWIGTDWELKESAMALPGARKDNTYKAIVPVIYADIIKAWAEEHDFYIFASAKKMLEAKGNTVKVDMPTEEHSDRYDGDMSDLEDIA